MDISSLQEFYRGFVLSAPRGNNAFSYEARSLKEIHVPSLINGDLDDVRTGSQIVFSDVIDGREMKAAGLEHFVHIERTGQDIFIFDSHNHAFSFWAAGIEAGVLIKGSTLVHVDQHKDTREPAEWFAGHGTFEACYYANHILNVGNFIPPALKSGWFDRVIQVGSEEALVIEPPESLVLDIDLDIFAPVMDYIPEDHTISRLRAWMSRASFITIATSPFFMDQARAIALLKELL